jgi:hypothetical protein
LLYEYAMPMNGEYVGFERETTRSTTISFDSRDIIYILKRMKLKFHEFHEGATQSNSTSGENPYTTSQGFKVKIPRFRSTVRVVSFCLAICIDVCVFTRDLLYISVHVLSQ